MASLQQRLRDPKVIKLAALATAILAISIGVGISLGGRDKNSSSSSSDALGKYASGQVGEIIETDSEATNYARYYGNGYTDYASSSSSNIGTTIRGSGIDNAGNWDDDGWSNEGGIATSKCDKGSSSSSASKAAKSEGRTRRLGEASSWSSSSSVWSPSSSGGVTSVPKTTSIGKSEKSVGTTSVATSKSAKSESVSEEEEDVDCETTTEVIVTSKASKAVSEASSKSSKTKSSKVISESSSKSTTPPVTVSNAWERSPSATVSNVWGSSPTSSPTQSIAPTTQQLESLAPVQASLSPTLSPISELTTSAPTPCSGRTWYYCETTKKCTNDGENNGQVEYENMLSCCENEVGINAECPYDDVCIESSPTPKPSTAKPSTAKPSIGVQQLPTTTSPSITPEVITSAPVTSEPTSDAPTVAEIITSAPTTSPVTSKPTSASPTSQPTLSPVVEPTTAAPTPCSGRTWYYCEEEKKCTNDGENDGQEEYENMLSCCENEVGMNVECQYEDVCIESSPTHKPSTAKPTSASPTSDAPTSDAPTIPEIITSAPSTAPVTSEPTSASPTSDAPTVPEIITAEPTTSAPVTAEPTSASPTSDAPTVPEIITAEPTTSAPVTAEPTVAPTPCDACDGGRQWYFDGEKCTNNGEFDGDDVVFENMQTCCKESFGVNVNCPYEDVCNKGSPTKSPTQPEVTPIPTSMPIETVITSEPSPAPTPCEGRKWYIVNISQESFQCTNGYDIPASAVDDFTFFDSLAECCDDMFGEGVECEYSDVCSNETPQPSSMEQTASPTKKVTTLEPTVAQIFTGEPTSPEVATLAPTKAMTAEPTTAEIFTAEPTSPELVTLVPTTATMNTVEPTPVPPSTLLTLAPTTCEERVWYLLGGKCTNMNENTSNDTGSSSYATLDECCENEMPGKECVFEDVCNTLAPSPTSSAFDSMVPTSSPSFGSTPTVSKETTGPPTILVPDRTHRAN